MSEVISLRLDKNNPREAQALEILLTLSADGYSVRHTLTEALIQLRVSHSDTSKAALEDLNEALNHVNQLLRKIESGDYMSKAQQEKNPDNSGLSSHFIASIKIGAKPGIRME